VSFRRFWRRRRAQPPAPAAPPAVPPEADQRLPEVVQLDADQLRQLSAVFAAPRWLRDLGVASWLLVGVAGLVVGLTWVLGVTSTIVEPVLIGLILATVASPCVSWLQQKHVPRALGALIVLLALMALGVVIVLLVVGGISSQSDEIGATASAAASKLQSWLQDLGINQSGASSTSANLQSTIPDIISTFAKGVAAGISGITSLAFFLSFTVFATFFLLKDGPAMRRWLERHLGVPMTVAETITGGLVVSIRRYFLGTTIVAGFNAVVVGLGALALGVPLAGTIAVVTLVTAYIPFIGAVIAGAFAVILALGAKGTTTALIMLVIVILANGALQNIVSPLAMGATLRMNPLLILVVTISAGSFFGMVGMVLAAPLTSAAIHITADLRRARGAYAPAGETATVALAEPP
jgi:predicted PurR-regulated permease PerM